MQIEDTEKIDREKVTELGLVATKRRILKEILKEVKNLEQNQSAEKKSALIDSCSSSSPS